MGVSFKTCLRLRGDVMMGRRCCVLLRRRYDVSIRRRRDAPLTRLGDVPSRCCWVFHLRRTCDVTGTYRKKSLRRRHDVLMPGGLLLADVYEKFRYKYIEIYGLDPSHFFSAPGLAWQACLKKQM